MKLNKTNICAQILCNISWQFLDIIWILFSNKRKILLIIEHYLLVNIQFYNILLQLLRLWLLIVVRNIYIYIKINREIVITVFNIRTLWVSYTYNFIWESHVEYLNDRMFQYSNASILFTTLILHPTLLFLSAILFSLLFIPIEKTRNLWKEWLIRYEIFC